MSRAVCTIETEPCADCNPLRLQDRWLHSSGCPVAVNLLRDAAKDRAWFAAHAEAEHRERPVSWAEAVIVRRALVAMRRATAEHELDVEWGLAVQVTRCDDAQVREFVGDVLVLSDSSGDQVSLPDTLQVRDDLVATNVLGEVASWLP